MILSLVQSKKLDINKVVSDGAAMKNVVDFHCVAHMEALAVVKHINLKSVRYSVQNN